MNIPRNSLPGFEGTLVRRKSPGLAGVLSLFPGLGQVYIGAYRRGFIYAGIFAAFTVILAAHGGDEIKPAAGLMLAFFFLYNIIDATRLAHLFNDTAAGVSADDLRRDFIAGIGQRGSIGGGIALLAGGVIFLLHTCFDVSMDWLADWWPLLPVGLGAWLVWAGIRDRQRVRRADGA